MIIRSYFDLGCSLNYTSVTCIVFTANVGPLYYWIELNVGMTNKGWCNIPSLYYGHGKFLVVWYCRYPIESHSCSLPTIKLQIIIATVVSASCYTDSRWWNRTMGYTDYTMSLVSVVPTSKRAQYESQFKSCSLLKTSEMSNARINKPKFTIQTLNFPNKQTKANSNLRKTEQKNKTKMFNNKKGISFLPNCL